MKTPASFMVIIACLLFSANCSALSVGTHQEVNSYVLKNMTSFNGTLKSYNISEGTGKRFKAYNPVSKKDEELLITEIIANGGITEDDPLRYGNHYHNPLLDWNVSGYKGFDTFMSGGVDYLIKHLCVSTPEWVQKKSQGTLFMPGNNSWPDARQYFYEALTATDEDTRNEKFTDCFTSVGQCMHLLQDMSVPAHVRDDSHAKGNIYEIWVNRQLKDLGSEAFDATYLNAYPYTPDPSLLAKAASGPAQIPITYLFDSDIYNGTNPNPDATIGAAGLAEYVNANFFSEDTILGKGFPYPAYTGDPATSSAEIRIIDGREYLVKVKDGESACGSRTEGNGYLLSTHGLLTLYATTKMSDLENVDTELFNKWFQADIKNRMENQIVALDDYCYEDYATKLLPRAVGYSKTLLDYFFRGSVEAIDAKTTHDSSCAVTGMKLKAKNTTPDENMAGGKLVASYSYTPEGGGATVYGKSDERQLSGGIATGATSDSEYTFTFDDPIPADAENPKYLLVYRGQLGAEADAVAAKAFEADVIVIDDWENGQGWVNEDTRSTLSLETTNTAKGSGALRVDVASGHNNNVIYNRAISSYYGLCNPIGGVCEYYDGPPSNPFHYGWFSKAVQHISLNKDARLSSVTLKGFQMAYYHTDPLTYGTVIIDIYSEDDQSLGSVTKSINEFPEAGADYVNTQGVEFILDEPIDVPKNFKLVIHLDDSTSHSIYASLNGFNDDPRLCPPTSYSCWLWFNANRHTADLYSKEWWGTTCIPSDFSGATASTAELCCTIKSYSNDDYLAYYWNSQGLAGKKTLRFSVKSSLTGDALRFVYGTDSTHTEEVPINIEGNDWEMKEIPITDSMDKANIGWFGFKLGNDALDSDGKSIANTIYIDQMEAY